MTGSALSRGMPFSPWQAEQICAFSSMLCARAKVMGATRMPSAAPPTYVILRRSRASAQPSRRMATNTERASILRDARRATRRVPQDDDCYWSLIDRERDDIVAALIIELHVAARGDHDVLLALDRVGRRRSFDAGASLEAPENGTAAGIVGAEPAVALAGEHAPARGREDAADHRLWRLHLPADLAGVVVDRRHVAPPFLRRADLEDAAEPQLALRMGRAVALV